MCEIPHITQYQHWISVKQTAAWYVLSWCCREAECSSAGEEDTEEP